MSVRETLHLRAVDPADVQRAAGLLCAGGLVAFATETVYGLGANALDQAAVAGIFRAKDRPAWDPLIVHVADLTAAQALTVLDPGVTERVRALAAAFWPGPLTLLLPRAAQIPDLVTAGRSLVGIRVPAHPAAQSLLRAAGVPVAAPSANRFGHTSPTTATHVLDDLAGRIDAVVDAGPCQVGLESTVLDPGHTPMVVYRSGAVTLQQIEAATGVPVVLHSAGDGEVKEADREALPSPGVGLRHYAPEARLLLSAPTAEELEATVARYREEGFRPIGVMLPRDWTLRFDSDVVIEPWGLWRNPERLASELFACLRSLERRSVTAIVCPLPAEGGLRDALRDRLLKAARPR